MSVFWKVWCHRFLFFNASFAKSDVPTQQPKCFTLRGHQEAAWLSKQTWEDQADWLVERPSFIGHFVPFWMTRCISSASYERHNLLNVTLSCILNHCRKSSLFLSSSFSLILSELCYFLNSAHHCKHFVARFVLKKVFMQIKGLLYHSHVSLNSLYCICT